MYYKCHEQKIYPFLFHKFCFWLDLHHLFYTTLRPFHSMPRSQLNSTNIFYLAKDRFIYYSLFCIRYDTLKIYYNVKLSFFLLNFSAFLTLLQERHAHPHISHAAWKMHDAQTFCVMHQIDARFEPTPHVQTSNEWNGIMSQWEIHNRKKLI